MPNIPDTLTREIYAELCRLFPPSPGDTPESRAIREQVAMTAVAHLLPENVAEAYVAVQIVAAQTYARDALQAASRSTDPDELRRCRAWAASMMRQADSGIRTLLRMQAERQKAEDALRPAAMQRAGYWFRSAQAEPEPTASGPHHEPAEPLQPAAASVRSEPPRLEYGVMTPAERFVTLYPDRAAAILAAGGLPARPTFQPPDPAVIAELLESDSPMIQTFRQAGAREPWPAIGLDPVAA